MKNVIKISLFVLASTLLIAGYLSTSKSRLARTLSWDRFSDPIHVKFEIEYPDYITPAFERDMNIYDVVFGDEMIITSTPLPASEYDPKRSPFGNPDDIFVTTINIDGFDASVFKTRLPGGSLSQSFSVSLYANGLLYTILVAKPDHAEHMLESLRILK